MREGAWINAKTGDCVWIDDRARGGHCFDACEVLAGERHLQGGDVLLQVLATGGAGDGNAVFVLGQDPGQGQLGGLHAFLLRDLGDTIHQLEVLLEIGALEARMGTVRSTRC